MRRSSFAAVLVIVFATGCPDVTVPVGRFACAADSDCPPGQLCGLDGICGSTFVPRDAARGDGGMDGGRRDGSLDGSLDAGMDASLRDAGRDSGPRDAGPRDAGPGRDAGIIFDASMGFPTMFRITDLAIRDPHLFADVFGCMDGTALVNDALDTRIGALTLSLGIVMRPYSSTTTAPYWMSIIYPQCTTASQCTLATFARRDDTVAQNMMSGTCLDAVPGTTSGYSPPYVTPGPTCFVSLDLPVQIEVFDTRFTLHHAQVAATFSGPNTLSDGLLRGFLRRSDAAATRFSSGPVAGDTLESTLTGGTGCCNAGNDRDVSPTGVDGWWMYFNFTATRISDYIE